MKGCITVFLRKCAGKLPALMGEKIFKILFLVSLGKEKVMVKNFTSPFLIELCFLQQKTASFSAVWCTEGIIYSVKQSHYLYFQNDFSMLSTVCFHLTNLRQFQGNTSFIFSKQHHSFNYVYMCVPTCMYRRNNVLTLVLLILQQSFSIAWPKLAYSFVL